MKRFFTIFFLIIATTINIQLSAQSKYVFTGGTLSSGTALSIGAVYQFNNVSTGVDATVTISNITGGISVTNIDGGGGFSHALQPVISVPANSNGYIELKIDFFEAGTKTPMIQTEIPITPIDVDGQMYSGLPLYEFDEIDMPNGYTYFQWAGTELDMSLSGSFARGKNIAAVDYPGIDTAQKTVMFTTINANISSITARVGADNQSGSNASRLRSLYFQRFTYPFEVVLPNRTLISFSGTKKGNGIELKGALSASHTFDKLIIEKGNSATDFETLTEINISNTASSEYNFSYYDSNPYENVNFYRIRLENTQQNLIELSNTLMVKTNTDPAKKLTVYNTMMKQNDPVIALQSNESTQINLYITNMSGQVVYNRRLNINSGTNSIDLVNFNPIKGYYVLTIKTTNNIINHKMMIH